MSVDPYTVGPITSPMPTAERVEPMLSEAEAERLRTENRFFIDSLNTRLALWNRAVEVVSSFFATKIASGELAVVKTVKRSEYAVRLGEQAGTLITKCCGKKVWVAGIVDAEGMAEGCDHCPGCGAKIVE